MMYHDKSLAFICEYCSMQFSNRTQLNKHLRQRSLPREEHVCPGCKHKFFNAKGLKNHLKIVRANKQYKCPDCDHSYSRQAHLSHHRKVHGGILFTCIYCSASFKDKASLKTHTKTHNQRLASVTSTPRGQAAHSDTKKPKEFLCPVCTYKFSDAKGLRRHLEVVSRDRPLKCPDCSHTYSRQSHLTAHMQVHGKRNTWQCNSCDASFERSADLKKHKQIHRVTFKTLVTPQYSKHSLATPWICIHGIACCENVMNTHNTNLAFAKAAQYNEYTNL